ncbi:MAG: hypothetical protein AAFP18_18590, partial [Bacteroidota bacterium]
MNRSGGRNGLHDEVRQVRAATNPTGTLWPADREREYSGRADIPSDLSPGTYEIIVEVDTDDEVTESN